MRRAMKQFSFRKFYSYPNGTSSCNYIGEVPMKLNLAYALLFLAFWIPESLGQNSATVDMGDIRKSSDGSGPSHLFWLNETPTADKKRSVIGVIDPLLSAVRLFYVEDLVAEETLHQRVSKAGVCALPISFRPWQIIQTDDGVLIESMPKPGRDGYRTTRDNFTSSIYQISRKLLDNSREQANSSQSRIDLPGWDPQAELQCGEFLTAKDGSVDGRIGRASPWKATRGKNHPRRTIILNNSNSALAPPGQLIVRAAMENWLYNARELEPVGETRIVQIAEGVPSQDGILRVRQSILAYRRNSITSEFVFDETLRRSKLGIRPIAIMPSGEVLAMGMVDKVFRIHSCGLLQAKDARKISMSACTRNDVINASREVPDTTPVADNDGLTDSDGSDKRQASGQLTANRIFNNSDTIANIRWRVDTQNLPAKCRSVSGCGPDYDNYVPLRGVRLTRGFYERSGLPYASTRQPHSDVASLLASISENGGNLTPALESIDTDNPNGIPGNIGSILPYATGLDCSALVQYAWGEGSREDRLSTRSIQSHPPGYICSNRIPAIDHLRPGDALSITVSSDSETSKPIINHVVLYASTIKFDNANDSWLVQESSSSCDGVCWSVFDPSFFNGWGLYRAHGRRDSKCPVDNRQNSIKDHAIPSEFGKWREKIVNNIGP